MSGITNYLLEQKNIDRFFLAINNAKGEDEIDEIIKKACKVHMISILEKILERIISDGDRELFLVFISKDETRKLSIWKNETILACCLGDTETLRLHIDYELYRRKSIFSWIFRKLGYAEKDYYQELRIACFFGQTEIVNLLLESDLLDMQNESELTFCLEIALEKKYVEIFNLLLKCEHIDINTVLNKAINHDDTWAAKIILNSERKDLRLEWDDGNILIDIIRINHNELFDVMIPRIKNGEIDVNKKTKFGTAFSIACFHNNIKMIDKLLDLDGIYIKEDLESSLIDDMIYTVIFKKILYNPKKFVIDEVFPDWIINRYPQFEALSEDFENNLKVFRVEYGISDVLASEL